MFSPTTSPFGYFSFQKEESFRYFRFDTPSKKDMAGQKANGTFASLQEGHCLWKALEEKPLWWRNILADPELYVEVRKDNYLNVYFYGGCLALVRWANGGIVAETNRKYAADCRQTGTDPASGNCLEQLQSKEGLERIKRGIAQVYHKLPLQATANARKKVCVSGEKMVQGGMILHDRNRYIDSELAYRMKGRETMRVDLTELRNQTLVLVELKLITDSRLRHLDSQPEIIAQMAKYYDFINSHRQELIGYYTSILAIKQRIGVWQGDSSIRAVSPKPELLIVDTCSQTTQGREARTAAICKLLETGKGHFDYAIRKYPDLCR